MFCANQKLFKEIFFLCIFDTYCAKNGLDRPGIPSRFRSDYLLPIFEKIGNFSRKNTNTAKEFQNKKQQIFSSMFNKIKVAVSRIEFRYQVFSFDPCFNFDIDFRVSGNIEFRASLGPRINFFLTNVIFTKCFCGFWILDRPGVPIHY